MGLSTSNEGQLLPVQPQGSRPFDGSTPYPTDPAGGEDGDDEIRQVIRTIFAPRLSCIIAVTFGVCFLLASCITIAALMPDETTTTTTTTTTETMTTTTTLTTTTGTTTTATTTTFTTVTVVASPPPQPAVAQEAAPSPSLRSPPTQADQAVPTTPTTTTTREPLAAVSLSMRVQHLDYARLQAHPELRAPLESQVKGAIAAEAGHGITPDSVLLRLQAGSVVVKATIDSLQAKTADAVTKGLHSSSTLGPKVADGVKSVWGVDSISTGPISVTDIDAHTSGGTEASRQGLSPLATSFLLIGTICLVASLATLLFLLWRRRQKQNGGYSAAAKEAEDPKQAKLVNGEGESSGIHISIGEKSGGGPVSAPSRPAMGKKPRSEKPGQALSGGSSDKSPSEAPSSAATDGQPKPGSSPPPKSSSATKRGSSSSSSAGAAAQDKSGSAPTSPRDTEGKPKAKAAAKAPAMAQAQRRSASSGPAPAVSKAKAPANAPAPKAAGAPPSSFVQTAMDMGFTEIQVKDALAATGGNEDAAMDKLLKA